MVRGIGCGLRAVVVLMLGVFAKGDVVGFGAGSDHDDSDDYDDCKDSAHGLRIGEVMRGQGFDVGRGGSNQNSDLIGESRQESADGRPESAH